MNNREFENRFYMLMKYKDFDSRAEALEILLEDAKQDLQIYTITDFKDNLSKEELESVVYDTVYSANINGTFISVEGTYIRPFSYSSRSRSEIAETYYGYKNSWIPESSLWAVIKGGKTANLDSLKRTINDTYKDIIYFFNHYDSLYSLSILR